MPTTLTDYLATLPTPMGDCRTVTLAGAPPTAVFLIKLPHTHLALLTHNRQINFRCGLLHQEIPTADGQVRRIAIPALLFRLLPDPSLTILAHYFDGSNPESQALLTRLATQPLLPCYLFNEHNQPQHLFETTNTLQDFLDNSLWLMRQAPPSRPDEVALAMALLPQTYPTERHLWEALDTPILSTAIS